MLTLRRRSGGSRGNAVVEMALMLPWIVLLFAAVFDFGFYSYAAITTANAARVAAMYTAASPSSLDDSGSACAAAIEEMRPLPNVKAAVNCPAACAAGAACIAGPIKVTARALEAAASADGADQATSVSVQYTTIKLFPLPWLPGQYTITRTVQMKVRG